MKTNYLFPAVYKKIGWILFFPSLIAGVLLLFNVDLFSIQSRIFALWSDSGFAKVITIGLDDEWITSGLVISLLLVCFSREKDEDEYISRLRGDSLVWATVVSALFTLVSTWQVYGLRYITILAIAPFITLILFLIKFHIALYRFRKENGNEE